MDPKQAMAILADVCRQFRGTLTDHEKVQTALATVNAFVFPAPVDPIKPE